MPDSADRTRRPAKFKSRSAPVARPGRALRGSRARRGPVPARVAAEDPCASQAAQTRAATSWGWMPAAWREQVSALPAAGTGGATQAGASPWIAVSFPEAQRTVGRESLAPCLWRGGVRGRAMRDPCFAAKCGTPSRGSTRRGLAVGSCQHEQSRRTGCLPACPPRASRCYSTKLREQRWSSNSS